jgi:glycosyltransferase involved in cell wall biosynthesis
MLFILGRKLLFDIPLKGWTSTIVVILFLGGAQLVSLGILGEYVARIFDEVKGRPLYVVKDLIGFDTEIPRHGETERHGDAETRRNTGR